MYPSSLKIKIAITLILLLLVGMLAVNLVMTLLWQRDMIVKEARNGLQLLIIIGQNLDLAEFDTYSAEEREKHFGPMLLGAGAACGSFYLSGTFVPVMDDPLCTDSDFREQLGKTAETGVPEKVSFGNLWEVFPGGKRYLSLSAPVWSPTGDVVAGIGMIIPLEPIYGAIQLNQRIVFVYIIVNVLILAVVGMVRFVKTTIRPLDQLVALTDSYSEKDGVPYFITREGNEFGKLSGALNRMMKRIEEDRKELVATVQSLQDANRKLHETQQEMVHTEKLASVGRLAAGLAHEIGNPVSIVLGYIDLLRQEHISDEDRQDFSTRAEKELRRISSLIRQLLDFARNSSGERQPVHVHELLDEIVAIVSAQPMMRSIEIHRRYESPADRVWCDQDQLRQVFLNCFINAADAIVALSPKRTGVIQVRTESGQQEDQGTGRIVIRIRDNGAGIPAGSLHTIFDPFFTTKEPGKGTGLGLSVSHAIIEGIGGRMWAEGNEDQGATLVIDLPLNPEMQ